MISAQLWVSINQLSPAEKWHLIRVLLNQLPPPIVEPSSNETDLGWPIGFWEQTYGSTADAPLTRPSQGSYESRESLA